MSDYFLNKIYDSLLSNKPVPKKPEPIVEKKETFKSLSKIYTSLYEQDLQGQLFKTVKGEEGPREEPLFTKTGQVRKKDEKHIWKEPEQPDDLERQKAVLEFSKEHKKLISEISSKSGTLKFVDSIHSALMYSSYMTVEVINECLHIIAENYKNNKPTTNFNIKTGNINSLFNNNEKLSNFWLAIKDVGTKVKQAGPGEWGFIFMCPKISSAEKGDILVSQDDGTLLLNRDNIAYELKLDNGRLTAAPPPSRHKIFKVLEISQLLPAKTKSLKHYEFFKLLLNKPIEERIQITKLIYSTIFDNNKEAGEQMSNVWTRATEGNSEDIIRQLLNEFVKISFRLYQQVEGNFNKLLTINTVSKNAAVISNENEIVEYLNNNILNSSPSQFGNVLISSNSVPREYWLQINPV